MSPATASPLSQWSQFSTFTGVRISRTGRPPSYCLMLTDHTNGGERQRSHHYVLHMVLPVKSKSFNSPSFLSNDPCLSR